MARVDQTEWPHKVKDTCDMCSASKVRCDKKKPNCSRCERLGYPCFYSPARRIRKHRLDDISRPSPAAQPNFIDFGHINSAGDGSTSIESHASENLNPEIQANRARSLLAQNLLSSRSSMSVEDTTPPTIVNRERLTAKRLKAVPPGSNLDCQLSPIFSDTPLDCATTAMDSILNLDRLRSERSSPNSSPNQTERATLDLVIESVSMAIRRTLTILICPCSRKTDVSLLAVAACSALLDTYQTFLPPYDPCADSAEATPTDLRAMKCSTLATPSARRSNPIPTRFEREGEGPFQRGTMHAKGPIMRILGELPRIADLITQFRKRYNTHEDEVESESRALIGTLVDLMTSRLKSMIDEFTHLLVEF